MTASHFLVTFPNQICLVPTDARASPWLTALGPSLPSRLIALLSKDSTDISTDTWCWQALYLVQAQLSPSQQDQILQHPTAQRVSPPLVSQHPDLCFVHLVIDLWCKVFVFSAPQLHSDQAGGYSNTLSNPDTHTAVVDVDNDLPCCCACRFLPPPSSH